MEIHEPKLATACFQMCCFLSRGLWDPESENNPNASRVQTQLRLDCVIAEPFALVSTRPRSMRVPALFLGFWKAYKTIYTFTTKLTQPVSFAGKHIYAEKIIQLGSFIQLCTWYKQQSHRYSTNHLTKVSFGWTKIRICKHPIIWELARKQHL